MKGFLLKKKVHTMCCIFASLWACCSAEVANGLNSNSVVSAAEVTPTPSIAIPTELHPDLPPVATGNYWDVIAITLGIIALLVFILGLFIWRRRIKSRKKAPPLTSFQQFIRDINQARINLGEPHAAKPFCTLLCNALKAYLQREYRLPLTCRTTEEFLKLFGKSTQFSWETINVLSDILQYSDRAKFAQEPLPIETQKELFIKTCQFANTIRRLKSKKASPQKAS